MQRLIPLYAELPEYTQEQEDILAATLIGKPFNYSEVFNTEREIVRIWDGKAFVDSATVITRAITFLGIQGLIIGKIPPVNPTEGFLWVDTN